MVKINSINISFETEKYKNKKMNKNISNCENESYNTQRKNQKIIEGIFMNN